VTAGSTASARHAGTVAVIVGLVVVALKAAAALRSGSLALLADAAEAVVNLATALVIATAARAGDLGAEARQRYGHGKLEFLSGSIEGAVVVLAAFLVALEAIARFGARPHLSWLGVGMLASVVATASNAALARHLDRVGRRHELTILRADATHLRHDAIASLAIIAGLGAAWITGRWFLDALVALAAAAHILVAGLRAVRVSLTTEIEEPLAADELRLLDGRLADEGPPVVAIERLRSVRDGQKVELELRLVISRHALVYEAHEICDRLEADLGMLFPGARVSIEVVPEPPVTEVRSRRRAAR